MLCIHLLRQLLYVSLGCILTPDRESCAQAPSDLKMQSLERAPFLAHGPLRLGYLKCKTLMIAKSNLPHLDFLLVSPQRPTYRYFAHLLFLVLVVFC